MASTSPSYVKVNQPKLEPMMKGPGLEEEDLDDVVFQHDTDVPMKAIRLLVLTLIVKTTSSESNSIKTGDLLGILPRRQRLDHWMKIYTVCNFLVLLIGKRP